MVANITIPLKAGGASCKRTLGARIRLVITNLGTFAKINREALKHRYGLSIPSWALKARCAQKVDSGLLKAAV